MKVKTYEISGINNFHNRGPITVRLSNTMIIRGYTDRDYHPISRRQATRIQNHFCGISDCRCPAGGIVIDLDGDGNKGILAE